MKAAIVEGSFKLFYWPYKQFNKKGVVLPTQFVINVPILGLWLRDWEPVSTLVEEGPEMYTYEDRRLHLQIIQLKKKHLKDSWGCLDPTARSTDLGDIDREWWCQRCWTSKYAWGANSRWLTEIQLKTRIVRSKPPGNNCIHKRNKPQLGKTNQNKTTTKRNVFFSSSGRVTSFTILLFFISIQVVNATIPP